MAENTVSNWAISCKARSPNRTHGFTTKEKRPRIYIIWKVMRQRCLNPTNPAFKDYGGRGITICERWMDFMNFLNDMGEPISSEFSIDRIDNNLGYSPENCRWSTQIEQANNRRGNRLLEFQGRKMTVAQWALEMKIEMKTLHKRLADGWSISDALTTPVTRFHSQRVNRPLIMRKFPVTPT